MRFLVKCKPGARENRVEVIDASTLAVAVTAPPVQGRANAAIVELLASYYRVPKTSIRIIRGATSRQKIIEISKI